MVENQYISVSQFNRNMKTHFDRNPNFRNVYVKGEVSGAFKSRIGNFYFTLKDKSSVINCIIYRRFLNNIDFEIKDGMKLLVIANVTVYPPHGKYQLDVKTVTEDGLGKLYIKYQQLKEKLKKEGLFKNEHKKPLSRFPKTIGVVTSKDGSVIHDIIKTVNQKWPYCQILLFPTAVQGPGATAEIAKQIKYADSCNLDVLIVGRGGGSLEDLWSFNEELVVKTIFNAKTPVISAVGHEDNVTLTDLVADKRASTPTMAASLAIEDKNIVQKDIDQLNSRLLNYMSSKIAYYKKELDFILTKPLFNDSTYIYASKRSNFKILCSRFLYASSESLNNNKHMIENFKTEYVIRHPCKMQLDQSRSNLNELQTRLIDSMKSILKNNQIELDKSIDNFEFHSKDFLKTKKHDLDIAEKSIISNPCQNQIANSKYSLIVAHEKIVNNLTVRLETNRKNLDLQSNNFKNVSSELILKKSHNLNSITNRVAVKNPRIIYESKKSDLDRVKRKKFLKNPYLILDTHKSELEKYKEKMDKISQRIELKEEQKKQKAMYIKIIIAMVIFMIIILILMFGGI